MSKKERLSKEDRLELEDFVDSIELGVVRDGALEPYNGLFGVWEVPILGHMVILNTKNGIVKTQPIFNPAFEFFGESYKLSEGEEIKAVLPPNRGERVVNAFVPSDYVTLDEILGNNFEDKEILVTLCHYGGSATSERLEEGWKEQLRRILFSVAKSNTKEQ